MLPLNLSDTAVTSQDGSSLEFIAPIAGSVRRVALTRLYNRLTAAAGDPPDTNIVLAEYQATPENLPELSGGKPAKAEAKKKIHFPNYGLILCYLR